MKRGLLVLFVLVLSLNLVLACVEDSECTSPSAPLCSPTGACINDEYTCYEDSHCNDYYDYYEIYGTICDSDNYCIVKEKISASACSSDSDCTASGSGLCSPAGACIADAKGCIVDDDCPYYYEYYGIYGASCSSAGACVYSDAVFDTEPSECLADFECVSLYGDDYECEGSYCATSGTSAGFVCGDGFCKGAEKNVNSPYYCSDDCETGEEGAVCVTRLDCDQDLDCVSGVCVQESVTSSSSSSSASTDYESSYLSCVDEYDCYEGEFCVDGYCELEELKVCFDDIECDEGYFCSLEGYCDLASEVAADEGLEYCDSAYPCSEGFYCDEGYCIEYIDTDVNFGADSSFGFLKSWNEGFERAFAVTKEGNAKVLEKQMKEREREYKQAQQLCVETEDEQCSNYMKRVDRKMTKTATKSEKFVEKNKDKMDSVQFEKLEKKVGGMVGGGREMAMKAKMIEEVGEGDTRFKERLESDVDVVFEKMEMAGRDTSKMQFKDRKVESFEGEKIGLEAKFAERGVGTTPLKARPEVAGDRPVRTAVVDTDRPTRTRPAVESTTDRPTRTVADGTTSTRPTRTTADSDRPVRTATATADRPTRTAPTRSATTERPTRTSTTADSRTQQQRRPRATGAITGLFSFLFFAE